MAPYPQPVDLAALGGSVGTPAAGIEAEVIEVPSLDAVDKLDPAQVKGKIVFFNVPMERTKDISGYATRSPCAARAPRRRRSSGPSAVVIRSIGTDNDRTPHTGAMRYAGRSREDPRGGARRTRTPISSTPRSPRASRSPSG